MATTNAPDRRGTLPPWLQASLLGIGYPLAVTAVLVGGSSAVVRLVVGLDGTTTAPQAFETVLGAAIALALVSVLYGAGGIGATYAYLAARQLDPGFVLEPPDREGWRMVGGLLGFAVVLVWAGVLVRSLPDGGSPGVVLAVPGAFLAPSLVPMAVRGVPFELFAGLSLLALAGVVGPALGVLFHGVVQPSLDRVVPSAVGIGATAVLIGLVSAVHGDVFGAVLVGAFAVGVGLAYERTGNLAVPLLGYATLNAFTVGTAMLFVLGAMSA